MPFQRQGEAVYRTPERKRHARRTSLRVSPNRPALWHLLKNRVQNKVATNASDQSANRKKHCQASSRQACRWRQALASEARGRGWAVGAACHIHSRRREVGFGSFLSVSLREVRRAAEKWRAFVRFLMKHKGSQEQNSRFPRALTGLSRRDRIAFSGAINPLRHATRQVSAIKTCMSKLIATLLAEVQDGHRLSGGG